MVELGGLHQNGRAWNAIQPLVSTLYGPASVLLVEGRLDISSWREMSESPPAWETQPEPNGPKFGRQASHQHVFGRAAFRTTSVRALATGPSVEQFTAKFHCRRPLRH